VGNSEILACVDTRAKDADLDKSTNNTLRLFRLRTARAIVAEDATIYRYVHIT